MLSKERDPNPLCVPADQGILLFSPETFQGFVLFLNLLCVLPPIVGIFLFVDDVSHQILINPQFHLVQMGKLLLHLRHFRLIVQQYAVSGGKLLDVGEGLGYIENIGNLHGNCVQH